MSSARVARRSPLLGSLHRVADGTLLGVITAAAVLAGLTLHCSIAGRWRSTSWKRREPWPTV